MATRFYLPSTLAADITPVYTHQASWNEVTSAVRRKMVTVKNGAAMGDMAVLKADTAATNSLLRQYISRPLAGSQTISGTIKGTIRCKESGSNDNLNRVWSKVLLVSNDGTTLRGAFLNLGGYGPVNEYNTVLEARRIADGDAITSQAVTDGDRIIFEVGIYNTASGSGITGTMSFGDDSATDLGDNETDQTAYNPFIEFSYTIAFQATTHQMSGSMSGGGTTSGAMRLVKVVSGALSGGGTTADGMKLVKVMSGAFSGGAATQGAFVLIKGMSGSLSGGGTTQGACIVIRYMTGSLRGGGTIAGAVVIIMPVTGSASGGGAMSGAVVVGRGIAGALIGGGTLSGDMTVIHPAAWSGALEGGGTLAGDMTVVHPSVWSGSMEGGGTISGAILVVQYLSGALSGGGTLAGSMNVIAPANIFELYGFSCSVADLAGDIWRQMLLSGAVEGRAYLEGVITETTGFEGAAVGRADCSGYIEAMNLYAMCEDQEIGDALMTELRSRVR